MARNIKVSSSDWIDLRTRGYTSGMYLLNAVGAAIEYSTAAMPVPGTTLVGSSAVLIGGAYLWVRGSGDCELYTASEWAAANVKTVPVMASTSSSGGVAYADQLPVSIQQCGIPFVIPAGDGGANGLSFTGGGGGAFTLSAAILTGLGAGLSACYVYLPADAGGSGNVMGWYFASFSSDTAGVIYADRYSGGIPVIPQSPAAFAGSPTGRITQTTSEVSALYGDKLLGGSMGRNGEIEWRLKTMGDTSAGTKLYRLKLGTTAVTYESSTTNPIADRGFSVINQGVENRQSASRAATGVGGVSANLAGNFSSVDTSVDQDLSVTMQVLSNTASAVLMASKLLLTRRG